MENILCLFGLHFVQARTARNITQWHVAARAGYHVTNLSKIEKGRYQPGVNLALRLLEVLDLDGGDFFASLWREAAATAPEAVRNTGPGVAVDFAPYTVEGLRCPFGPLLLQVRLATSVTQKTIAEKTGYNLRNMNKVEKGEQEPGVMTALYMVVAAGGDVRCFWTQLMELCHKGGQQG